MILDKLLEYAQVSAAINMQCLVRGRWQLHNPAAPGRVLDSDVQTAVNGLWQAGAENPVSTYDKRHPVPFGEYVPNRDFFMLLAPDLIGLIQREV